MKFFITFFFLILLSGCAVASLASSTVSTAAKVIEFPIKVIGKVIGKAVTSDEDEEEEEEEEED